MVSTHSGESSNLSGRSFYIFPAPICIFNRFVYLWGVGLDQNNVFLVPVYSAVVCSGLTTDAKTLNPLLVTTGEGFFVAPP